MEDAMVPRSSPAEGTAGSGGRITFSSAPSGILIPNGQCNRITGHHYKCQTIPRKRISIDAEFNAGKSRDGIIRSGKDVNMIPANVLGNLCVVPIVYFLGAQPLLLAPVDAGLLLLLGTVVLPISFAMITLGPRYLQAPEVSLILLTETILGPIWVWLALGEVPHSRTLVAGLLILGTLLIHTLFSLRQLQTTKS